MDYRFEYKYTLPEPEYMAAFRRLKKVMPFDSHCDPDSGEYAVRTLYFDDMQNSAFWDKKAGISNRKKFRMRTYNYLADSIMLEKKTKNGLVRGKETIALTPDIARQIIDGDINWMMDDTDELLHELAMDMRTRILRPVIMTDYIRQAFVYPAGNVRITFDRFLRTGPYSLDIFSNDKMAIPVLPDNRIIMEVKFDHFLPPHIQGMIQSINGVKESISKYALSRRFHY